MQITLVSFKTFQSLLPLKILLKTKISSSQLGPSAHEALQVLFFRFTYLSTILNLKTCELMWQIIAPFLPNIKFETGTGKLL